jgi:hypothetical protein
MTYGWWKSAYEREACICVCNGEGLSSAGIAGLAMSNSYDDGRGISPTSAALFKVESAGSGCMRYWFLLRGEAVSRRLEGVSIFWTLHRLNQIGGAAGPAIGEFETARAALYTGGAQDVGKWINEFHNN